MFYLISKEVAPQSGVLAQSHDLNAINELLSAFMTIGQYTLVVVSDEFDSNGTQEELPLEEEEEEEEEEVDQNTEVDFNSFAAFKQKTAYCSAEIHFLMDVFSTPFSFNDIQDILNDYLQKRYKKAAITTPTDEAEIKATLATQKQADSHECDD